MLFHLVEERPRGQLSGRILVVDDEPGMRRSLAIMLRREQYHVTEAGSVTEAVERLKGNPFDLIIADLRMEPLNGLDLLVLVRRYQFDCPIILLTAFGTPETRSEALRLGAADFLDKPLQASTLLQRVREILSQREA